MGLPVEPARMGGIDPDGYISYGLNFLFGIISKIKIRQSSAKDYMNSIFKTLTFNRF